MKKEQLSSEDNLINIKIYKMNVPQLKGNLVFIIKLGLTSDKINLVIEGKENSSNFIYKIKLNYNDFQSLSKSFKICDTLDEIHEKISEIFNNNNANITFISQNYIHLSLKVFSFGGEIKEIKIELKRIINPNDTNNDLYNKIIYLENEIIEMKNKFENKIIYLNNVINLQNEKINLQNRKITELNNWKNQYSKKIEKMQIIKYNETFLKKINSKILKNKDELDFIESRLYNNDKLLLQKKIIYKLLYRGSENGFSTKIFHNLCDNIRGTLTIVKTTKSIKFGGYTEQSFKIGNSYSFGFDRKGIAFGFSLDLYKIYNYYDCSQIDSKNRLPSIYIDHTEGPSFGSLFNIYQNSNNNLGGSTHYTVSQNHFGRFEKDYEINNGWDIFSVQELEVFQIIFD